MEANTSSHNFIPQTIRDLVDSLDYNREDRLQSAQKQVGGSESFPTFAG